MCVRMGGEYEIQQRHRNPQCHSNHFLFVEFVVIRRSGFKQYGRGYMEENADDDGHHTIKILLDMSHATRAYRVADQVAQWGHDGK